MKKILFILSLLIVANISFGQGKILAPGNVGPTGNYPIVVSKDIKGTVHFFLTIAQRNALPANYRDTGMIAYVADSTKFYYLQNGIDNSYWTPFTFQSGYVTTNHPYPVETIADMLALDTAKIGDIAIVADSSKSYVLAAYPASTQGNWLELLSPVLPNTDYLPEGVTHLYYTDARARNAISGGSGISYNSVTGVISELGISRTDSAAYHSSTQIDSAKYSLNKLNGDKTVFEFISNSSGSSPTGVQSVTGTTVDETDPVNPVVNVPTLQQAFDASISNGDTYPNSQINGHDYTSGTYPNNDFMIDSMNIIRFLSNTLNINTSAFVLNLTPYPYGVTLSNLYISVSANVMYLSDSITENDQSIEQTQNGTVIYSSLKPTFIGRDTTGLIRNIVLINAPYIQANVDSIAVFQLDTLKKVAVSRIFIDSTITLSSGTITVSDPRVKTGAKIFLSVNTPSGTQGFLSAKTSDIVNATSFIINSTSATETSTVNYEIINP